MLTCQDLSSGVTVLLVVPKAISGLVGAVPSFHTVGQVHEFITGLVPVLLWSCRLRGSCRSIDPRGGEYEINDIMT